MVAKHVNNVFLLLLLQRSVLWLSIVTLNDKLCKATAKLNFAQIWCITYPTLTSLGYPTFKNVNIMAKFDHSCEGYLV